MYPHKRYDNSFLNQLHLHSSLGYFYIPIYIDQNILHSNFLTIFLNHCIQEFLQSFFSRFNVESWNWNLLFINIYIIDLGTKKGLRGSNLYVE